MSRDSLKVPSERVGVAAAFAIHATGSGTWAPRLPAIKASLDLSTGMLGTALVGLAVGLLAGTRLAGTPVDRFGSRPVMRAGFPVLCAVLVLPALARSAATLFLALLALGLASGILDVAMNAQGVEVERHRRRPLLSGLHGLWSVGLGAGAGTARSGWSGPRRRCGVRASLGSAAVGSNFAGSQGLKGAEQTGPGSQ